MEVVFLYSADKRCYSWLTFRFQVSVDYGVYMVFQNVYGVLSVENRLSILPVLIQLVLHKLLSLFRQQACN